MRLVRGEGAWHGGGGTGWLLAAKKVVAEGGGGGGGGYERGGRGDGGEEGGRVGGGGRGGGIKGEVIRCVAARLLGRDNGGGRGEKGGVRLLQLLVIFLQPDVSSAQLGELPSARGVARVHLGLHLGLHLDERAREAAERRAW